MATSKKAKAGVRTAKEPQNQDQLDTYWKKGAVRLGPWTSHIWRTDPRHIGFLAARYKFCAKMLVGKNSAIEIGCGDAFGTPIVHQTVRRIHGIDLDPIIVEDARDRFKAEGIQSCTFDVLDITQKPAAERFEAAYSLDVIEHIPSKLEDRFMTNVCGSLKEDAVCIVGTPNIEAHKHASPASALGHINLKSGATLQALLAGHFANVFLFSMNDEVVHTGFYPMAHYLLAMGVGPKAPSRSGKRGGRR